MLPASLMISCSSGSNSSESDTTSAFHADDDIAMVVQSLADAVNVGESLKVDDYNFTGVLTDGTGRPLYSDLDGMPGEWTVEVQDSTTAVLRNTRIGDLEAEDLQNYIAASLQLDSAAVYIGRDFKGRTQSIYTIPGGYLTMTVRRDTTPGGIVGDRMSIIVRK